MSLMNQIVERTQVMVAHGSKRKHLIWTGSMAHAPRIWDSAANDWAYIRPILFAHYGIKQVRNHTMPSCGHERCLNANCLKEGQEMTLSQIPRLIQSADIFTLAASGAFADIVENLDSLSITRVSRQLRALNEKPRWVPRWTDTETAELFA